MHILLSLILVPGAIYLFQTGGSPAKKTSTTPNALDAGISDQVNALRADRL